MINLEEMASHELNDKEEHKRAQRLAFLIDAAPYFAAVRSAIAQAKRSVFILGWDFDSRIRLVPHRRLS